MKKLTLALITTLSLSTISFAANAVPGSNGQMKFSGAITESGCNIVTGNGSTIDLGSHTVASIRQAASNWTQGYIKFVDCQMDSGISAVSLQVVPGDMVNVSGERWLWKNQGTAKNVNLDVVFIGDEPGYTLTSSPASLTATIDPVNRTATYIVAARIIHNSEITEGSIEVTITYIAHYK
ncbi:hypothetical protein DC083_04265 [Ignatzschineria ureiclastica]|uniref:Type 1 fimbrial protein n=1 Tax=Ignatzschineria ureiclastica TaxID=472582 RepID=A0A2U2AEP1_9GAMM|nr:type 1 fimbrial protein [Ignatzschineria ureiclastica]PWD81120.1 hypothetical protein DC083_04265 [Ignatzschineria ureiclastica]